jgi:hypothetical protein
MGDVGRMGIDVSRAGISTMRETSALLLSMLILPPCPIPHASSHSLEKNLRKKSPILLKIIARKNRRF